MGVDGTVLNGFDGGELLRDILTLWVNPQGFCQDGWECIFEFAKED